MEYPGRVFNFNKKGGPNKWSIPHQIAFSS
jgi:hypothetical protein